MAYEITMPILSDTMESGKLIKWHVKPGDHVKKGDVIADVESDKAIMEVQSFKEGTVKELKAKEGDEVPVKSVIAVIETEERSEKAVPEVPETSIPETETKKPQPAPSKEKSHASASAPKVEEPSNPILEILSQKESSEPVESLSRIPAEASPAAKRRAAQLQLDLETLQKEGKVPVPAHLKDVESAWLERYFTPAARALIKRFDIDPTQLKHDGKVGKEEVERYIRRHALSEKIAISSNQKAIISHIEKSAAKPVYHIYDRLDLSKIPQIKGIKLTSWIVKLFADTMMTFPLMRTIYREGSFYRYEGANIAIAVATEEALFTPVLKNADVMGVKEINEKLQQIKQKAKEGTFKPEEFHHSSFGISNLGMFGIEAFDALINQNDAAMAAIGAIREGALSVTIAFDHRVVNGKEGALFVQALKMRAIDTKYMQKLAKRLS